VSRARFLPTPISVAVDTVGGLYVGLPRPGPAGNSLLYYSTVALSSAHPTPTAVGRADRVDKITADPAGGVVVVSGSLDDGSAKVGWWNPVAS
jgi:hypothetical protein